MSKAVYVGSMQIIAVLNQKGGAGKTTLATHLARSFHLDGRTTVLVDSDPQGSARDWASASDGSSGVLTVAMDRPNVLKSDVRRLAADVAIIDGAPSATDLAGAAVAAADLVLIPVQPSPYDIWAAAAIVEMVEQRRALADGSPAAAFIVNRAVANSVLESDVKGALDAYEIPVLSTVVHQRQSYPRTAINGLTVVDVRSEREAAAEIRSLYAEVRALLPSPVDA